MAGQPSFDVTSTVDVQEVDNAVNQAKKEIAQRYDFKGSKSSIDFKRAENVIDLVADDTSRWKRSGTSCRRAWSGAACRSRTSSRRIRSRSRAGSSSRTVTLQQGIPTDAARDIVKFLKDQKLKKVQAAIQGDQLRVSSSSKDDLQAAIRLLKAQDFGVELQFGNYRE